MICARGDPGPQGELASPTVAPAAAVGSKAASGQRLWNILVTLTDPVFSDFCHFCQEFQAPENKAPLTSEWKGKVGAE